jgi:hypothetical protein
MRTDELNRARECARLTMPWILPEENRTVGTRLFTNNQSLGSRGVSVVAGKLLMALFPPDQPWFGIDLSPEFQYNSDIPADFKQAVADRLWLQQLQIAATIESSDLLTVSRPGVGFRIGQHHSIMQMLVTGDTLEELTDDYKIEVHRRDRYVTKRDDAGCVLYHIVKKRIDPVELSQEDWVAAKLDPEIRRRPVSQRMLDLYTYHEWQHSAGGWVIKQEVNGYEIRVSEEAVSRLISTPFQLVTGENYGHGLVEQNGGDLASLDFLTAKLREAVGNMARMVPVLDSASAMDEEDLVRPSGEVIRGRVNGGAVQDAAFLQSNKHADVAAVSQYIQLLSRDLAKAFLLESAVQPQKERVTARQIDTITEEVQGALGGLFIPISEHKTLPILRRVRWQMKRDGLIPAMKKEAERMVRYRVLTGLPALARQATIGRVVNFAQTVAALGPQAMARIDEGVLIRMLERANNFYEPGLVKTNEQVAAEQQQAIRAQAQIAANEQIAKTAGNVVETAAGAGVGA